MAAIYHNNRRWLHQHQSIQNVEQTLNESSVVLPAKIQRLETTAKVMQVVTALLLVLASGAMLYLPVWVPFGVCFPLSLLLGITSSKFQEKADAERKFYDATLLLRGQLSQNTLLVHQPHGEWDLPAVDPQLRSDRVMQKELEAKHPKSAARIAKLVHGLDLEVTPILQTQVSSALAQVPDQTEKWNQVRALVSKAKKHLYVGEFEEYEKLLATARELALLQGGEGLRSGAFQGQTEEAKREALAIHFKHLAHLYKELITLYAQLGKETDPLDALLIEGTPFSKERNADQLIIEDLKEWLAARHPSEGERLVALLTQRAQILTGRARVEVKALPQNRIAAFRLEIDQFDKSLLSDKLIERLGAWLNQHPDRINCQIGEVRKHLGEEICVWLVANEEVLGDSLLEVYEHSIELRKHLAEAQARFPELNEDNVDIFEALVMVRLRKKMHLKGYASKRAKLWADLTTSRFQPPFKAATIEERDIHNQLMKVDRQRYFTNIFGQHVLEWGILAGFLVIEAIFWSNPWVVWGGAILSFLIKGGWYYLGFHLRKLDKQKQGYKMHRVLSKHPTLSRLPGNRPGLQYLQATQQRYDLSGVTRTWSRTIAEGNEVVLNPRTKEEAKQMIRALVHEGNAMALPVCRNELIRLLSLPARTPEQEERVAGLRRAVFPPRRSVPNRQEPTDSEKRDFVVKQRQRLEHAIEKEEDNMRWTVLVSETVEKAEQTRKEIERQIQVQAEDKIKAQKNDFIVMITLLDGAMEGETDRDATGDLEQALTRVLNREADQDTLRQFPVEVLVEKKRALLVHFEQEQEATEKRIEALDHAMRGGGERREEGDLSSIIANREWNRLGGFPVEALAAKKVELLSVLEAFKQTQAYLTFHYRRKQVSRENTQLFFSFVMTTIEYECDTLKQTIALLANGERKTELLRTLAQKQRVLQDVRAQHYLHEQAVKVLQKDNPERLQAELEAYKANLEIGAERLAQYQYAIAVYTSSLLLDSIQKAIDEWDSGTKTEASREKMSKLITQLIKSTPDTYMHARLRASHLMTWEAFKVEIKRDKEAIEQSRGSLEKKDISGYTL